MVFGSLVEPQNCAREKLRQRGAQQGQAAPMWQGSRRHKYPDPSVTLPMDLLSLNGLNWSGSQSKDKGAQMLLSLGVRAEWRAYR